MRCIFVLNFHKVYFTQSTSQFIIFQMFRSHKKPVTIIFSSISVKLLYENFRNLLLFILSVTKYTPCDFHFHDFQCRPLALTDLLKSKIVHLNCLLYISISHLPQNCLRLSSPSASFTSTSFYNY